METWPKLISAMPPTCIQPHRGQVRQRQHISQSGCPRFHGSYRSFRSSFSTGIGPSLIRQCFVARPCGKVPLRFPSNSSLTVDLGSSQYEVKADCDDQLDEDRQEVSSQARNGTDGVKEIDRQTWKIDQSRQPKNHNEVRPFWIIYKCKHRARTDDSGRCEEQQ